MMIKNSLDKIGVINKKTEQETKPIAKWAGFNQVFQERFAQGTDFANAKSGIKY